MRGWNEQTSKQTSWALKEESLASARERSVQVLDGFPVRLDCSADRPRLTLALFNKRDGYTTFGYADHDTQLFCTGTDSISVHQGMNADLLAFTGWFSSKCLAVNGDNRTIARWRHFTTTTRILEFVLFLCKSRLLFFNPQRNWQI